tara:strand:- start:371 stop:691 length:321 start_codon:yes stop_codon:yes gene_type:complete
MPFEKGNQYGSRAGRPKGSANKTTQAMKTFLETTVFDEEEFIRDWKELDVYKKMEMRVALAKYIIPEQKAIDLGVHQFKEQPLFLDDGEVELLGADGNEVYWKDDE